MSVYYQDERVTLHHGDALDVLRSLPDASVDSIVTDPPYGLEFMGKDWDAPWQKRAGIGGHSADLSSTGYTDGYERLARPTFTGNTNPTCRNCGGLRNGRDGKKGQQPCRCDAPKFDNTTLPRMRAFQQWCEEWAAECLRVLKPGGHLLAFGGTRTWHRLACAVEDAGFEVRDSIAWLHGQGFPKSANPARDQRFCQCTMVESDHADGTQTATEHGLSGVLVGDVPQAEGTPRGPGSVLLPGVPQPGAPTAGRSELPAAEVRPGEPCMAGRGDHPQAEGELHRAALREVPGGPAVHGEVGRLHHGAQARDGALDRATASPNGSGESHQPRPAGQPAGEPGAVPQQRGSQAWRGGQVCAGCGKPPAPVGLGTALKPAFEPVVVARKPLTGTVAANVLQHGTGALNIDGCRVGDGADRSSGGLGAVRSDIGPTGITYKESRPTGGRWPANVVLDDSQAAELDEMSGESRDGVAVKRNRTEEGRAAYDASSYMITDRSRDDHGYGGQGGASRFFPTFRYEAKAPASERPKVNGVAHPTVKPLDLLRWLVRLVTPPGGTVLEPFAGSGTTVEACIVEGFHCIAIEREADYLPLITQRINRRLNPVEALRQTGDDLGLFELEGDIV